MKSLLRLIISIISIILLIVQTASAQLDSVWHQKPEVALSAFADVFYAYDFNRPQSNDRQPFLYNHNRHNEFNLNLGYVKLAAEHIKYRGNLALQTGTYANDNYADEPGTLKNILEANAGISMDKKNKLWLDAGIFASHIGFESAVSLENPTLTRSLLAENSPYFLSGAKLSYSYSKKWDMAVLVCNGWQRIQRIPGNSLLSLGTQLQHAPNPNIVLNWSTFIGTDDPDSTRRMRYFNNFYGQFQVAKKLGITTGIDIGVQQQTRGSSDYHYWLSPVLIVHYTLNEKWAIAFRTEYFQDENGVIIPTGTANGFKTTGVSLNIDYMPIPDLAWRIEGRWFNSRDPIFGHDQTATHNNFFIVTSLAVKFGD